MDKDILDNVVPGTVITLNNVKTGKTYNLSIEEFESCLDENGNIDIDKVEKLKE